MANTPNQMHSQDDFIMSPTVDICFVNLMRNPFVRKGFCAAILRISPEHVGETVFLPRYLEQEYADDKLELQFLELKKLPKEVRTGDDIINWMRFFNGKTREEFKNMAKTSIYFEEAFDTLQKLSADDKKRLEYEAREKVLRDHISFMDNAKQEGIRIGVKQGEEAGIQLSCNVLSMHDQGSSIEEIVSKYDTTSEIVLKILKAANKL